MTEEEFKQLKELIEEYKNTIRHFLQDFPTIYRSTESWAVDPQFAEVSYYFYENSKYVPFTTYVLNDRKMLVLDHIISQEFKDKIKVRIPPLFTK